MNIYIAPFNCDCDTAEELKFDDFLTEEEKEKLNGYAQQLGLVVSITSIENPELYAKGYYERKGYKVKDLRYKSDFETRWIGEEWTNDVPLSIKMAAREVGTPDFLCWKNTDDFFFVESKRGNDGFRINQIRWLFRHKLPFKLFYVE
jgi:hypothetical protein